MILSFGEFELDVDGFQLRRGDAAVEMEPQVFEVLAYLAQRRDRLVTKHELLDGIWGDRFVSESALTSRIKAARRAVDDDGSGQAVIRTVRGRGYQFVAETVEHRDGREKPRHGDGPASPIRYARSDDLHIGYQVTGAGPPDIVLVPGFVSHLSMDWENPDHAHFLRRLGEVGRLIRFDKRGTGLSDRPAGRLPDLERRMDDVRAVMGAAGSERAVIFGYSEGGPMAVLFAAMYPTRTSALVLYGSYAKRLYAPDYPWAPTPEERRTYGARLEREWSWEADMQRMCPNANDDTARWWGERCRAAASPGAARALIEMNSLIDVREVLGSVQVPTLVLHRRDDRDSRVDEGRYLAEHIPNARFIELPGADHFIGVDPDQILDPVQSFLSTIHLPSENRGFLTTVVAAGAEGAHWTADLRRRVTEVVTHHGGTTVQSAPALVLGMVDGPARAVECALEIAALDARRRIGVGVHVAEVFPGADGLQGPGLDVVAAIAEVAPAGTVVVSDTLAGLLAGSRATLDEWRVFPAIHPRTLHICS